MSIPASIKKILGDTIRAVRPFDLYSQDVSGKWKTTTHGGTPANGGYPVGVVVGGYVGVIAGKQYDVVVVNKNGAHYVFPLVSGTFTVSSGAGRYVAVEAAAASEGNGKQDKPGKAGKSGLLPIGKGLFDLPGGELLKKLMPYALIALCAYALYNEARR